MYTETHKYRGESVKNIIMKIKYSDLIQKYNDILYQYQINLKITNWTMSQLLLTSSIILTGTEIRKFRSRCKSPFLVSHFDIIYSEIDSNVRDTLVKTYVKQNVSNIRKRSWNELSNDAQEQRRTHMRQIRTLVDYDNKPKSIPWSKGKTKHDDERLLKLSNDRRNTGNPMYGRKHSDAMKKKKSEQLKLKILSGKWTPHIHNSRTHWTCSYEGIKYRSSWEAMYASLNPRDTFETIRIPYVFNGQQKIYIVDFCNTTTNVLTEIKPMVHQSTEQFVKKVTAATKWCEENGYTFRILGEQYFIDQFNNIPFDKLDIPNIKSKLSKIIYEANKTNQNNQT